MRYSHLIIFLICLFFLQINYSYSIENKILIKINDKIITTIDLYNEIKILKLLNNNMRDLQDDRLIKIASKSLTKQLIKETELLKYNKELKLTEDYLNSYLINYSKKLKFNSKEDFLKYCEINSINIDMIKKKIKIELLWNQFIYQKFLQNVKIDKNKIKKDILKKKFIEEYLLLEIVFNVEKKNNLQIKLDKIKKSIEENGFEKTALNYSISDTSKNGGVLGWIKETTLSPTVRRILKKTDIKKYTKPIQIPGGFLILYLKDLKKIKVDLDIDKETKNVIKIRTNKQLDQFSTIYLNKIKKDFIINEF